MRPPKAWKAIGAVTLVLLSHAACTRRVEFGDISPLEVQLPSNLRAEAGKKHEVAKLFKEFHELFLSHPDAFDWYQDSYSTGEMEDSEEFTYTWQEGVLWRDLPLEVRGGWEAILDWHTNSVHDPSRRLIGDFGYFFPLYWGDLEFDLLLGALEDKNEALHVLAHLAQVIWEESTLSSADGSVASLWTTLMESPHFTAEQIADARAAYPLDRMASLQRTRWLLVEAIQFLESGEPTIDPGSFTREDRERIAGELDRMVEILAAQPPFLEDDILFLRSTYLFERTRFHSYFLDTEIDLPWATEDPWVVSSTTGIHYAQLPTTIDYYTPFRAKVWDQEQWVTGTGFLGIDEQGTRHLIFHPRARKLDDTFIEAAGERVRMELQLASDRVLLAITNRPEGSAVALGTLTSSEVPPEGWDRDFAWPWRVWPSSPDIPMDFDLKTGEWRLSLPHADGEDLVIFERGGPWSERPEEAIPVFAEPEPGRFTRGGVELVAPYWNLHVKH